MTAISNMAAMQATLVPACHPVQNAKGIAASQSSLAVNKKLPSSICRANAPLAHHLLRSRSDRPHGHGQRLLPVKAAVEVEGETAVEEPAVAEAPLGEAEGAVESEAAASEEDKNKGRRRIGIRANRRRITVDVKDMQAGQSYTGKVKSIMSYGCFVDIGAFTDGLVHISELSSGFVDKVEDVVSVGQEVTVVVKDIDLEKNRLGLSMRDREAEKETAAAAAASGEGQDQASASSGSPRKVAGRGSGRRGPPKEDQRQTHNLKKGQVVKGTVKTLTKFGAFVELEEGVEGLLHGSEIGEGGEDIPIENQLQIGQEVEVRILEVKKNRISLSMKPEVDLKGLNKGLISADASNPFVEAFRRYNLIPEPKPEEPEEVAAALEEAPAEEVLEATTAEEKDAEPVPTPAEEIAAKVGEVGEGVVENVEAAVEKVGEVVSTPEEVVAAAEEAAPAPEAATPTPEPEAAPEPEEPPPVEAVTEEAAPVEAAEPAAEAVPEVLAPEEPSVVETVAEGVAAAATEVVEAIVDAAVTAAGAVAEAEAAVENIVSPEPEAAPAPEPEAASTLAAEIAAPVAAAVSAAAAPSTAEVKAPAGISAAAVKALRDETGAGMMACKSALNEANGDLEKAKELLRKKGLASAEKKASRIASEGLVHSYIHDGRIGVLIEVNCETDFVSRGAEFKELVEDLSMQVAACPEVEVISVEEIPAELVAKEREIEMQREDLASKPEAIRAKIVDGRIGKALNKFALLEQPFIKNDKILVKDYIKERVAKVGENIQVRRFERFNLGEGLAKKSSDFAAEVAAASAVKVAPKEEAPAPASEAPPAAAEEEAPKVAVSASSVKALREATGAGMMDCKKALAATNNDLDKATEFLRKKGLASAEKKAGRAASEGLIGSYIHDGRFGCMIEVNCETDFVARGEKFQELVKELAMQVVACPQVTHVSVDDIDAQVVAKEREIALGAEDLLKKPEAVRGMIVDGRMGKRMGELALLEQPYIRNDKILIKDLVKETVAGLGENIQIRRFERFNLGEGIEKKTTDFAAEVAAVAGGQ